MNIKINFKLPSPVFRRPFLPLGKKPKGYCYEQFPPSLPPSVNFSVFFALQVALLDESSRFLVCELLVGGEKGR